MGVEVSMGFAQRSEKVTHLLRRRDTQHNGIVLLNENLVLLNATKKISTSFSGKLMDGVFTNTYLYTNPKIMEMLGELGCRRDVYS